VKPFFFLKVRKGKDYQVFNPVDNKEYVLNYIGYRILEYCDGAHESEEISGRIEKDFGLAFPEASDYVTVFLEDLSRLGMIAWRQEKFDYYRNWHPPSTVFWDITGECNLRCAHCYNFEGKQHENELSTEEIIRTLEEMSTFGVKSISFSGGEPFMRTDMLEIVHHAVNLGFDSVGVSTNGILLDRDTVRQLTAAKLNIQISIDGDDATTHDNARRVKGAFEGAISSIRLLLEEGVNTSVCTTASTMNVDRIPDIIQLMDDLGVKNYRVQGVVPMGRGKMNAGDLRLTPARMKELVEYLENRNIQVSSYNMTLKPPPTDPVNFCDSGVCSAASSVCSITPEGNVVPCTYFWGLNGDNLRDRTFQWIWENSALLNYFRSIRLNDIKGSCRDCKWLLSCHGGCKAENYSNGDIFESSRSCWVAEEMKSIPIIQ
jgi:radical SAM protein with 4Fe4S-binding SPASM domain